MIIQTPLLNCSTLSTKIMPLCINGMSKLKARAYVYAYAAGSGGMFV